MTRLTLETSHGKYVVETEYEDYPLDKLIEELVVPVLRAAGYHEQNIREALAE